MSGILGPDGKAISAERVKLEKQTRFNPLRNWTPDVLVRQLEAYSRGEIAALAWVMEWLEKHDDIIATVAPKAKAAVSRWGYDVLLRNEVPEELKQLAQDQQGKLQDFFENLLTSDAVELEEMGGMRLLVQQIMDGYGKGYAAHHIIWKPKRNKLHAELIKVPTWFFEVTTGKMKYLQSHAATRGVDLNEMGGRSAWMISKGRGVMLAGALARMFKQIPLQDWLTYCDRHGMPAFLGKTNAQRGTEGWNQMVDAVSGIGAEFGAVVNTGDMIDVLTLTGQGEIPYAKLIDRMDRALVMLWRGGDLSTISRENGTGSNPQQEDSDELDADNAEWVSEIINRNLTEQVIRWHYGPDAPILCRITLRTKTRENLQQDMQIVKTAKDMGIRISKTWFTNKFQIVEADKAELALGEEAGAQMPGDRGQQTDALNSAKDFRDRIAKLNNKDDLFSALAAAAQDESIDDAAFLQMAEEAVAALQLVDEEAAEELAEELNNAMAKKAAQTLKTNEA